MTDSEGGRCGPRTLAFPGGMAAALDYAADATARGEVVVGASSLRFDPASEHYPLWETLPYYDDPGFADRLRDLVGRQRITRVFTSHPVVHAYLRRILPDLAPGCELEARRPWLREVAHYRALLGEAAKPAAADCSLGASPAVAPRLAAIEIAALHREAEAIPGMCSGEKIWALAEIFRHAVPGDIVEIGSWWGKSAYVLCWLSRRNGIGQVLCADPWSDEGLVQDHPDIDDASAQVDAEEAWQIFTVNLAGIGRGLANYIRATSVVAARQYHRARQVESKEFGTTTYRGSISILHIDGNHKADLVAEDLAAWSPALLPGAWIVFDDYVWRFGDGPRRIGDAFLARQQANIVTAFVAGSALFVQIAGPVP